MNYFIKLKKKKNFLQVWDSTEQVSSGRIVALCLQINPTDNLRAAPGLLPPHSHPAPHADGTVVHTFQLWCQPPPCCLPPLPGWVSLIQTVTYSSERPVALAQGLAGRRGSNEHLYLKKKPKEWTSESYYGLSDEFGGGGGQWGGNHILKNRWTSSFKGQLHKRELKGNISHF